MTNPLPAIADILDTDVDQAPLFRGFDRAYWVREVVPHTGALLKEISRGIDASIGTPLTIKDKSKRSFRLDNLQTAAANLSGPFSFPKGNKQQYIQLFVIIGPNFPSAGTDFIKSICWGLQWYGADRDASRARRVFSSLFGDSAWKVQKFSYFVGGPVAWVYRGSVTAEFRNEAFDIFTKKVVEELGQLHKDLLSKEAQFLTLRS